MTAGPPNKFFFIHVMKTGGTSFAEVLKLNFSEQERYPDGCLAPNADFGRRAESYLNVPSIVKDVNENSARLRVVAAHIPYATRSLFSEDYVALTLLRHPVERTLSYLKHCRHYHEEHRELALEAVYELPWFNATFINNYQTRIFSMSAEEATTETRLTIDPSPTPPLAMLRGQNTLAAEVDAFRQSNPARFILEIFAASTGAINIDDNRLSTARANLDHTEVVGVTEHYDKFLNQLHSEYGWQMASLPRQNVGAEDTISEAFKKRIAEENAADMALYDYALTHRVS